MSPGVTTIVTGSRLHFGPLAWKPIRGRDFGGWGVMLETPRLVVRVGDSCEFRKSGQEVHELQGRAERVLEEVVSKLAPARDVLVSVSVEDAPESHSGLGSGTQLSLAVAAGAAVALTGSRPCAAELARMTGRGLRSAVGVYGFDAGGLIVDAGKRREDALAPLAARVTVPEAWRFVLVRPRRGSGLMGDREAAVFRDLPAFPESLSDRLSRIVLTEILPATRANDCAAFAAALQEYGERVGLAFSGQQGGVVHPESQGLWDALKRQGVEGMAQTSWGPTLAIVAPREEAALELAEVVRSIDARASLQISAARNRGADVLPGSQAGTSTSIAPGSISIVQGE